MTITVHIDISTPKGRKILRELEKNKEIVVVEEPVADIDNITAPDQEKNLWDKLSDRYGIDLRSL